ncbi:MAG: energy-dependent translational throttle protein EttA [bacterium]|nr:energy-dependent translational throttle protein EttA [bacterium]
MADKFIFTMLRLNKFYGQKQVLKDINLSFFPGAKIGIVGENGSGKSTVLKIMAGMDDHFQGTAEITPGYKRGIVPQEPRLDETATVKQNLEMAFGEIQQLMAEYDAITAKLAEPLSDAEMDKAMTRMGELQDKLDAADAWNLDQKINRVADALCLPDDDRSVATLSGGEKRRVAICKILLEQPDLVLLDEPTNHLDAETVDWLEAQLKEYPGTVIIVTHDRYFLDNITRWILELESGKGIPWEGNYTSWLEQKLKRLAGEAGQDSPRKRMLERELSWIKMSNKDRHEMSRTRLAEYEQLVAKETAASKEENHVITIAPAPHLGDQVVEFDKVSKGYGDNLLIKEMSFKLPKAAVVGVIGPNGAGKTTLFKMITGDEKPDTGTVAVGPTVKLAFVEQMRDSLNTDLPVIQAVCGGDGDIPFGNRTVPARQYLARFGFKGSDQQKSVQALSGGERNRAHLAQILKAGGNLILLDEPTNDLDVNTLRLLEEAILAFSGCAMIISHDRFFLNRICTHLLVFEGEGNVRWFEGNYQEYEEWRMKELGSGLFENRRNRYRKLSRI